MQFKGKVVLTSILMLSLCYLSSCATKTNLLTISFDVSYDISTISDDDYKPSIHVFDNKDELIDFFGVSPYYVGENFYNDIEQFETKFGFDHYLIAYFEQMLNASCTINAYIDEVENDCMVIVFDYNYPKSDIYLPADSYYQGFYLIDKDSCEDQNMRITFKIEDKVLYIKDF